MAADLASRWGKWPDRSKRAQERLTGAPGTKRPVAVEHITEVGAEWHAAGRSQDGRGQPDCGTHRRGRRNGQPELRPGNGGHPEQGMDLLADPAAADQHEPLAPFGKLVGELHRDTTAERMADDGDPVHVEHAQQVAHAAGVRGDGIVRPGLGRLAMAEQVGNG